MHVIYVDQIRDNFSNVEGFIDFVKLKIKFCTWVIRISIIDINFNLFKILTFIGGREIEIDLMFQIGIEKRTKYVCQS